MPIFRVVAEMIFHELIPEEVLPTYDTRIAEGIQYLKKNKLIVDPDRTLSQDALFLHHQNMWMNQFIGKKK
jgi:hypothetical protein